MQFKMSVFLYVTAIFHIPVNCVNEETPCVESGKSLPKKEGDEYHLWL